MLNDIDPPSVQLRLDRGHLVAIAHEGSGGGDDGFTRSDTLLDLCFLGRPEPDLDGTGRDDAVLDDLDRGALLRIEHRRLRHEDPLTARNLDARSSEGAYLET